MDKKDRKAVLQDWQDLLTQTLVYHAERFKMHLESGGVKKWANIKTRFLSHHLLQDFKNKFGLDIEHISHRIAGAVTHRDWRALADTVMSSFKNKIKK